MKHYHKNPRQITRKQFDDLRDSLRRLGDLSGVVHDLNTDEIIGGNQRMDVFKDAQVVITEQLDAPDEQGTVATGYVLWNGKRYAYRAVRWDDKTREEANIRANKAGGDWDKDTLANEFELDDLLNWGFTEFELGLGVDDELMEKPEEEGEARKTLAERFIVPPFSVLDARQGYWQERKRAWIATGIESELGRGKCVTCPGDAVTEPGLNYYRNREKGKGLARSNGQDLMKGENQNFAVIGGRALPLDRKEGTSGTSIFDPVLCELVYRWFCPPAGSILDPFAGGSVRGVVASLLGHPYTGIDLRPEQIEANEAQAQTICKDTPPRWMVGDSRNIHSMIEDGEEYDLVFSCPPYFDLEVYSDNEKDLSTAGDYAAFIEAYNDIIAQAVARLKHNRFACFVVGDIRDKQGFYRNFVSDTIAAFEDAGAVLYNEAILVTAVGSLPIRVGKQFQSVRKLGKTHQNVLVFYKGDPRKIKEFGEVEAGEVGEAQDGE